MPDLSCTPPDASSMPKRELERTVRPLRLAPLQRRVLKELSGTGSLLQKNLTSVAISEVLSMLERDQLVKRERDVLDRRAKWVRITDEGNRLVAEL